MLTRNPRLLLYIALVLAAADCIAKVDAPQQLPLIKADWPVCVKLNPNGPLIEEKKTIHGKGNPEWT